MAGVLVNGCGSSSDTSETSEIKASKGINEKNSQYKNIVYAKVTKVENSEITYEILERDENAQKPEGSDMPDGEAPQKPEGSAMPDGEGQHNGEMKKGDNMMGFVSTGETKTITVDASVTISFLERSGETSEAALTDITEGSMIQLQYSDDNQLTEINIPQFGNRGQKEDGSQSDLEAESDN